MEMREEGVRAIDVDAIIAGMRRELGVAPPDSILSGRGLLARVRAEVARRKMQAAMSTDELITGAVEWVPVEPRMQAKREYVLGELLRFDDEDFVNNAYLAVLRRHPDAAGFAATLHALREGASKVELLGKLRWSQEGVGRGVHVDGLLLPYTLHRWEQKRYVGMVVAWLHSLLKLGVMRRRQRVTEARQARETHEIGRLLNRLSAVEMKSRRDLSRELKGLACDVERKHSQHAAQIETSAEAVEHGLGLVRTGLGEVAHEFHGLKGHVSQVVNELEVQTTQGLRHLKGELAEELRQLNSELRDAKDALFAIRAAVNVAELRIKQLGQLEEDSQIQKVAMQKSMEFLRSLDPLYADFEDAFRGSKDLIRLRAAPYLDWVREGGDIGEDAPILDIGCGRGEWMELARDHGMAVRGVDLNRTFVESCREMGFDVTEGDALSVLKTMPEGSVGAVTSMHLVEHLPFDGLVQLLDEAFRVLRPGGVLALETPNPENLSVASHWFFLDPTHRNPLPPVTLAWLVRQRGFVDSRIERLMTARDLRAPALLPPELAGASSINVLLERLGAAADYSIVARKPNV